MIEQQLAETIPVTSHQITIGLLIVAIGIFGAVAAKSKDIKSFQFQMSVFIMIWIAGEMVDFSQDLELFSFYDSQSGMQIHLLSMVFFGSMLWLRFYFTKLKQKKIVGMPLSDYF